MRCGHAEDAEHHAPDRVGGEPAIADQVREGLITRDDLVLAVGLDQVEERLRGQVEPVYRFGHPLDQGVYVVVRPGAVGGAPLSRPGAEGEPELVLDFVEGGHTVTGVVVADLVHEPGPAVKSHEVGPHSRRQQPRGDREVLGAGAAEDDVLRRQVRFGASGPGRCTHRRCRHVKSPLCPGRAPPAVSCGANSLTRRSS